MQTLDHPQQLTPERLNTLAATEGDALATILLPTHRGGRNTREDPIRFKNLIGQTSEHLLLRGTDETEIDRRLEPLRTTLVNDEFWQHQLDGLAAFIGEEDTWLMRLSVPFDELAVVGSRFHLKPLLAPPHRRQVFYIVAASMHELDVFRCGPLDWAHVNLDHAAGRSRTILRDIDEIRTVQSDNPDEAPRKRDSARAREYFHAVTRLLHELGVDYQTPVIYAGVDAHYATFKEAANNIDLLDEHLAGNHDEVRRDINALHSRSAELLAQRSRHELHAVLDRYGDAAAHGRASTDISEIVLGAHEGRVETLLLDPRVCIWGHFHVDSQSTRVSDQNTPDSEDLINLAAVFTHQRDGRIMTIPPPADPSEADGAANRMPDSRPIAAIYRF